MQLSKIRERLSGRVSGPIDKMTANAVLVPMVETADGVCLLFETRSKSIIQGGDVCFPGGMCEEGESPLETALRETEEELGISADNIEIIAPLDYLQNHAVLIYPFAAVINEECLKDIRMDEEVDNWFLIPLDWLIKTKPGLFRIKTGPVNTDEIPYEESGIPRDYHWRFGFNKTYYWPRFEGHLLWGLTARITVSLLESIENL